MKWVLFIVLLSGCAGGQSAAEPEEPRAPAEPEPKAPAEVVEAARGAVEQYRQAYQVASLDALEPLYVRGEELVVVSEGERHRGWEAVRVHLEELLEEVESVRITVEGLEVVALGETSALATVNVRREVKGDATTVTERGVLTLVFQLRRGLQGNERWRIVGEHYSKTSK